MSDNLHRAVLKFDDGIHATLICPESGCIGTDTCGFCGADLTDPESKRCYDCAGDGPHECWIKTWFDNCSADELLHGEVTVTIRPEFCEDHAKAHIVSAPIEAST